MVNSLEEIAQRMSPEEESREALRAFANTLSPPPGPVDSLWYEKMYERAREFGFELPQSPFNIGHVSGGALELSYPQRRRRFVMSPLKGGRTRQTEEGILGHLQQLEVVSKDVKLLPDELNGFVAYDIPYVSLPIEHAIKNTSLDHVAPLAEYCDAADQRLATLNVMPSLYVVGMNQHEISVLPPFLPRIPAQS